MARLNTPYNPAEHNEMADYTPLPAGDYLARIIKSEMKQTKDQQGQYLELEFALMGAGNTERKVWTRLNLVNRNPTAVELAQNELKSICVAAGITGVLEDSDALHGKPMLLTLKVTQATAQYGPSNAITRYKGAGDNPEMQGGQTTIPGMEKAGAGAATAQNPGVADKPAWS